MHFVKRNGDNPILLIMTGNAHKEGMLSQTIIIYTSVVQLQARGQILARQLFFWPLNNYSILIFVITILVTNKQICVFGVVYICIVCNFFCFRYAVIILFVTLDLYRVQTCLIFRLFFRKKLFFALRFVRARLF